MLNQIFPVYYQNECYMVDPQALSNSSLKFKELISPFINNFFDLKNLHLRIIYDKFSTRNINNFLRICQDLPTDVQNSEIFEISEIALLFQAEHIFNTAITFIHTNIDSNFSVSCDKFQGQYLLIESEEQALIHDVNDLNELEFDDSYEYTQHEDTSSFIKNNNNENIKQKKSHSVVYQIKIENPLMKCRRFLFTIDNKVIYTAKQKDHQIFIGEGNEVHINENKMKRSATITQSREGYNIVSTEDQQFKINYLRTNPNEFKKSFSMKLTFMHNGLMIYWCPKIPTKYEKIYGEYQRQPIQSKKNILLQNKARHTTFIVRKMDKKIFEAECHSTFSPLIAFSIALSQIVGPFM
ncbi:hypothetical protein M9Y10_037768 [Tritrichomonas musculus]|uniref:Tubby C-terminal domain-containing protein n=1 Tax=Tritrichomonas musculus TaxID=1915356 RepID=A0ABR2GS98_9EUKA